MKSPCGWIIPSQWQWVGSSCVIVDQAIALNDYRGPLGGLVP
jgi:hypothetical protein